ncbi:MAG TPA: VWA domain-containing protein [Candidatus Sulfotelmatobacter sp.]|nr:VWA domain-containing protein [Candidatus Sulfotelmatobacter sp.]
MKAAAGFCPSVPAVARMGVLLCCLLVASRFVLAAQSPQPSAPQQAPAPQPTPEITTTQQAPPPAKPSASSDSGSEVNAHPSVPFESHVNLVPVRVVVHDSSGKVVTNLTKEDFRLFQDRRLQTISHFSMETPASTEKLVVRGEAAGEPTDRPSVSAPETLAMPTRFVALLFDDVHLKLEDLVQARVAAAHFLDTSIGASERVAVFTTSGQTQVDFTDDRAKIRSMVTQLMPHFIGGTNPTDTSQCPPMNYYEADLITNKNDLQAIAAATQDAIACTPNLTANAANALVMSTALQLLTAGDINTEYAIRRLLEVVRRISSLPGQRSIVLVSPGFLTSTHEYEVSDVIDRATRANVFINTLEARGLYTIDPLGDVAQPLPVPSNGSAMGLDLNYRIEAEARQSDVLSELSDGTGGFYFRNNNDLGAGFRMTTAVPEVTYLLAFTPEALKFNGQFHTIKVTVSSKEKCTVQARRGFFAPKHGQTPEESAKQDIEEAVFSQEEQQGVPIELQLQYFKSDAVDAKLSVLTHVDVTRVRFEKAEGRNLGNLTVVAALFDRNGNFIAGNQETVDLRLKDATLEKLTHTGMTLRTGFDVKSGGYIVRLVVRDSKASVLSAKNGVIEIP